jgi:hypothetical protein
MAGVSLLCREEVPVCAFGHPYPFRPGAFFGSAVSMCHTLTLSVSGPCCKFVKLLFFKILGSLTYFYEELKKLHLVSEFHILPHDLLSSDPYHL